MKKFTALLFCMLMMITVAFAEIEWPTNMSEAQRQLQRYVECANEALDGSGVIDMRYEMYSTFASLGMNGAEMPEDPFAQFTLPAEMYFVMTADGLQTLQLRMPASIYYAEDANGMRVLHLDTADVESFSTVAAACLHASSPTAVSMEQARTITEAYATSILAAPSTSFGEDVVTVQGNQPRAYFAYFPNQFRDNAYSWIQMTLVFPYPDSPDAPIVVPISTPAPENDEDQVYLSEDNYQHLEVFVTPTPEPDSAAME